MKIVMITSDGAFVVFFVVVVVNTKTVAAECSYYIGYFSVVTPA